MTIAKPLTIVGVVGMLALSPTISAVQQREMEVTPQISSGQFGCATFERMFLPSASFAADPDIVLTIKNGTVPRNVIVQYSAETVIVGEGGGMLLIGWSVDGGPFTHFGPRIFHNADIRSQTRTTIAVIPMAAGTHTIRPGFRYLAPGGTDARIAWRCATAEGRTK